MRNETEMMKLFMDIAQNDERIRILGMEGSRTNINVPKDEWQDYDISFIVTDMESYLKDDLWLDIFGKRVIMQKPESMSLFPPELDWFSYLMIFDDGIKIDLKVIPLEKLQQYLESDKLLKILLDEDKRIGDYPEATDKDFWIYKPSVEFFNDCCNEFWFVSTYIAKGLWRNELLFATWHMEQIARPQLFNMLTWKIGISHGYDFSVGKHFKYIKKYLAKNEWALLTKTYSMNNFENCREALRSAMKLFRETSKTVSEQFGFIYPDYDEKVTEYLSI
jgi:aminoglycoside 6-adenylyltransferase